MSKKISELESGVPALNQNIPVQQGQTNARLSVEQLRNYIGGLKGFVAGRGYEQGEAAIINGIIQVFVSEGQGLTFNSAHWVPLQQTASRLGFPLYSNSETYDTDDYVEFLFKLFKQISAEPVQGIAPLNHPDSEDYWTEISQANGEFGLDYAQSFSDNGGEVIGLKGTVWQVSHEGRLRLFKAIFSNQSGQAFISTDFAAELAAERWVEVAGASPPLPPIQQIYNTVDDAITESGDLVAILDQSTCVSVVGRQICVSGFATVRWINDTGEGALEINLLNFSINTPESFFGSVVLNAPNEDFKVYKNMTPSSDLIIEIVGTASTSPYDFTIHFSGSGYLGE